MGPAKAAKRSRESQPVVLIMAGGKGERFWPRSRLSLPKQLQKVYSNRTLLQETIDRALLFTSRDRIFIGCNAELKKATRKIHPGIKKAQFIVEPEGRNTAPIIALAALELERRFGGAVQVVLSADHYIAPPEAFRETIENAVRTARDGWLVTLGVRPTRPEVGYGYIRAGAALPEGPARSIEAFQEKPGLETAREYLADGNYFWNSGIFIWQGRRILEEFEEHAPDIIGPLQEAYRSKGKLREAFSTIPERPVEIKKMEKSKRIAMIPATFSWDDVGSWLSLERILEADRNGNVRLEGKKAGAMVTLDAANNVIVTKKNKLVALLGVSDTILVEEGDVVFLAARDRLDDIKKLLAELKQNPGLQKYLR